MSLGDLLPLVFYEAVFMLTFVLLPYLAYKAEMESFIFGMLALYMCLRVIRGRMKKKLPTDGKAVLITGCDSGFGHLAAIRLDAQGYTVFAGCLSETGPGVEELKSECSDRLRVLTIDVTDDNSVRTAGKFVRENLGDTYLWGLVNNAGIYVHGDVELCTMEAYQRAADVNLFGVIRVTKEFLPLLRQSQGRCVMMSSNNARFSFACSSAYTASKKALEAVSDSLRMEMVKFGVKVAIIQPAMFGGNTDLMSDKNISSQYVNAEQSWEASSEEIRSTYSKKYLTDQITALALNRKKLAAKTPDPVIDAIEDGLTSSIPNYRYLVHGGPFGVDPLAIYGLVFCYLPESVTDWICCKLTGTQNKDVLQGFFPKPTEENVGQKKTD